MGSPETCPTCGGRTIFTTRPCGGDEWNEYYRGADCRDPFHPWNEGPDVGDDDPACTCRPLGKATCIKHATPTPPAPETCPTCGSEDRSERFALDERGSVRDPFLGNVVAHPCDDPWHSTPTPPAPADDAKSPFPAPERAAFPSLYCAIYPDLIPVARSLGYALAIHGSVSRDLDLIAVPWTEDARPPEELVEAIRAKFDGWIGGATTGHPFGDKPHGRRAWSIMLGGHAVVDLSVVPVVGAPAAAPSRVEEARRAFYEAARESVRLERAVSDAFDAEVRTGRDHGEADLGAQANAARDEKEYAYDALLAAERAAITESTTP